MDLTAIDLGREVGAETVIDVTHAVIGTLQTQKILYALPAETFIVEVGALALDRDLLLTIDTIDLVVGEVDEKMMTVLLLGIEAHVVTVLPHASELLAQNVQRASLQHRSLPKTSVTEGLCSFNSLLLG